MKKLCVLIVALTAMSFAVFSGCTRTNPATDDPGESPESAQTSEMLSVSQTQPASESSAAETPQVSAEPSPETESQRKKIYYIGIAMGNYDMIIPSGAVKAGEDLGCDIILQGASPSDTEGQTLLLETAIALGADAIIIKVVDREAMAGAVSEAYRSGIPIVLADIVADTEDYSACLIVDNFEAGRAAAAEMLRKLKNSGLSEDASAEIAVQIGSAGAQAIIDRLNGFKTYWQEHAPPQWAVLWDDVKVNEGDIEKATEIGLEFLANYPDLKAMFAPNNGSTVGFVAALKESNRTDITLVGFDLDRTTEELIRDEGFNVSTILRHEFRLGYESVIIALELADGGTVAEKIIDVGVVAFDIDNIDNLEMLFLTYSSWR